jgi:hypothetical protein
MKTNIIIMLCILFTGLEASAYQGTDSFTELTENWLKEPASNQSGGEDESWIPSGTQPSTTPSVENGPVGDVPVYMLGLILAYGIYMRKRSTIKG